MFLAIKTTDMPANGAIVASILFLNFIFSIISVICILRLLLIRFPKLVSLYGLDGKIQRKSKQRNLKPISSRYRILSFLCSFSILSCHSPFHRIKIEKYAQSVEPAYNHIRRFISFFSWKRLFASKDGHYNLIQTQWTAFQLIYWCLKGQFLQLPNLLLMYLQISFFKVSSCDEVSGKYAYTY